MEQSISSMELIKQFIGKFHHKVKQTCTSDFDRKHRSWRLLDDVDIIEDDRC